MFSKKKGASWTYDTPSLFRFFIFFSSDSFHRMTRSYRNILAPRITHGFGLAAIG